MKNSSRTELSELGEFGLISRLAGHVSIKHPLTIKGIGDDCAVWGTGDEVAVITTDMLVEGIHFDLSYVPLKHLGYKSVIASLSDVYAMNANPGQITVAIALSNRFSLEAIEELYLGITTACERYGVDLVGGDTTSIKSGMVISVTAVGAARKEKIVYRKGAAEKELLVVTGDLGGAYMGLQLLEREKAVFLENPGVQPDLGGNDYILERQLKPEARQDIVKLFDELGLLPTSMIDISDGLASEILHLAKASDLGCYLYEEKIPIDPTTYQTAREFDLDPTLCALSGGEDYELLFTIRQSDYDKVKNNPNFTVIGHMMDKNSGCMLIDKNGGMHEITAQGWDALRSK